jgi:hypothetical protein
VSSSISSESFHKLILRESRLLLTRALGAGWADNSDPNCTRNDTKYGSDPDCFSKVVNEAKSWAADAGLPFLLTE